MAQKTYDAKADYVATCEKFKAGMAAAGFDLSDDEVEALVCLGFAAMAADLSLDEGAEHFTKKAKAHAAKDAARKSVAGWCAEMREVGAYDGE